MAAASNTGCDHAQYLMWVKRFGKGFFFYHTERIQMKAEREVRNERF